MENIIKKETFEKGKNTEIVLRIMRHGDRDLNGRLTNYGKETTKKKTDASSDKYKDFFAVKPIGSEAGKRSGFGARALETAEIFAHGIDPDTIYNTRAENTLSYETLINKVPYNHVEIYNANLPENHNELSDDKKAEAAKIAQKAVLNHSMSLETPDVMAYKKESAGAFAYLIKHYMDVAKRIKENSKVLIPAGTHGGIMEMLLKYALVQENNGEKRIGFSNINDIGGEFSPSDGYDVDIKTDEYGKIKKLLVNFDTDRPVAKGSYLDSGIVDELASYYESLHFKKENK